MIYWLSFHLPLYSYKTETSIKFYSYSIWCLFSLCDLKLHLANKYNTDRDEIPISDILCTVEIIC
jgi:hypothetical protein